MLKHVHFEVAFQTRKPPSIRVFPPTTTTESASETRSSVAYQTAWFRKDSIYEARPC
jgi:hypothetical protein